MAPGDALVDLVHRQLHREAGADGALGVVLVGDRGAEDRHHVVADVLVDAAAVAGDLLAEAAQGPVDHRLHRLRDPCARRKPCSPRGRRTARWPFGAPRAVPRQRTGGGRRGGRRRLAGRARCRSRCRNSRRADSRCRSSGSAGPARRRRTCKSGPDPGFRPAVRAVAPHVTKVTSARKPACEKRHSCTGRPASRSEQRAASAAVRAPAQEIGMSSTRAGGARAPRRGGSGSARSVPAWSAAPRAGRSATARAARAGRLRAGRRRRGRSGRTRRTMRLGRGQCGTRTGLPRPRPDPARPARAAARSPVRSVRARSCSGRSLSNPISSVPPSSLAPVGRRRASAGGRMIVRFSRPALTTSSLPTRFSETFSRSANGTRMLSVTRPSAILVELADAAPCA